MGKEELEGMAAMIAFIAGDVGWKNISEERKKAYCWGMEQIIIALENLGYTRSKG